MESNDNTYYGLSTSEQLRHHTLNEFVESYLDEREPENWPDVLDVVKWERQKLGDGDFECPNDLYDRLDEEYSCSDGDTNYPSEEVQAIWEKFVAAVKDDYHVWACEPTDVVYQVNVKKWVQENRPNWLAESAVQERFPA